MADDLIYKVETTTGSLRFARFIRVGETNDRWRVCYMDGTWESPLRRNVQIKPIPPGLVVAEFFPDMKVLVRKYGSWYNAVVTKVAKTRVTVRFTTVGGKVKETTVPAVELRVPGSFGPGTAKGRDPGLLGRN